MNHHEITARPVANRNPGNAWGRRQSGKEGERQMPHSLAKLQPVRSVPGVNRVERFQRRNARPFAHSDGVQPGIG
jgi:hypothetical protein